ncbi:MAG: regulator, partial [Actinobacteria bacterium]
MWLGTIFGVSPLEADAWISLEDDDGLYEGRVTTLAIAPDGTLWIGTNGG